MTDHEMRVTVGGVEFASASGSDYDEVWRTVMGYARGYAAEGEAVIEAKRGGEWRRVMTLKASPF